MEMWAARESGLERVEEKKWEREKNWINNYIVVWWWNEWRLLYMGTMNGYGYSKDNELGMMSQAWSNSTWSLDMTGTLMESLGETLGQPCMLRKRV